MKERAWLKHYSRISKKLFRFIPFTYYWYWYLVNLVGTKGDILIDFGCGCSNPVEVLQNNSPNLKESVNR